MKKIIKLNLLFIFIYFFIQSFNHLEGFLFFRAIRSIVELLISLPLLGLNLSVIIRIILKYKLNFLENLNLSIILSLIVAPFFLTLESEFLKIIYSKLPIINYLVIFLILTITIKLNKESAFKSSNSIPIKFRLDKIFFNNLFSSSFFWASIVYIVIIFIINTAYYSLPDIDPYRWMANLTKQFENGIFPGLFSFRPFFSSLYYIFIYTSKIDSYVFLKYIIPSLLILVLFPAWLIAKKNSSKIQQFIILLFPLASASTILYSQIAMPQTILIILTYYFLFLMIYSLIVKNDFFFYLAGFIAFFAYFYHESAGLLFFVWFLIILWNKRDFFIIWVKNNRFSSILILALIISNAIFLLRPFIFIFKWLFRILSTTNFKMNWFFPAIYTNIDKNPMGWSDMEGVTKYYLYYAGPVIIIIIFFVVFLIIKNYNFRKFIKNNIYESKELQIIFLIFLIFFSISEILPRFFNIALLPERAWIFGGIFSFLFIFLIFRFFTNKKIILFYLLIIISFLISISGAIYINNLKKFIITENQLESAEWIRKNLPQERIILTCGDKGIFIEFYGYSQYRELPIEACYDIDQFNKKFNEIFNYKKAIQSRYDLHVANTKKTTQLLNNRDVNLETNYIIKLLDNDIKESRDIQRVLLNLESENKINWINFSKYIYYSKNNENNPYLNRPYYKKVQDKEGNFIFDQYPDKFQRVYVNNNYEIIIWKVL